MRWFAYSKAQRLYEVNLFIRRRVRLSVCLSHAGIDSKLMNVGSCGLHRRLAQGLQFSATDYHTQGLMGIPFRGL